jgi:hypothetical protein
MNVLYSYKRNAYLCVIWGSYSGVLVDPGFLGCDAVSLDYSLLVLIRNILPFKRRETLTQRQNTTSQMTFFLRMQLFSVKAGGTYSKNSDIRD